MVFQRFQTGLVFVLRLNTIFGFKYRALTRPRLQAFKIRLENESRVGTPIRQNLVVLLSEPFHNRPTFDHSKPRHSSFWIPTTVGIRLSDTSGNQLLLVHFLVQTASLKKATVMLS